MQQTFIQNTLENLSQKGLDITQVTYVVPSKRVGLFLNKEIASRYKHPIFAPLTLSIEDYIQELSGLHILPDIEILPYFYQAYCLIEKEESRDSFDSFIGWAPTILKDFNELDRYLVNTDQFFDYLGNYKALDTDRHWSLEANPTEMVTKYLDFWQKLSIYYKALTNLLRQQEIAYQGMAYRVAFTQLEAQQSSTNPIIFMGLNALNTVESKIIQDLLNSGKALIYWDTDEYFMKRSYHEAGKFIREHKSTWNYYQSNDLELIGTRYVDPKTINLIATTGNLGIVQAARKHLELLSQEELLNTAVVLADEQLLLPFLNALPDHVNTFNITMGLTLDQLPISSFFIDFFKLHQEQTMEGFYYKNVIRVLESNYSSLMAPYQVKKLLSTIRQQNLIQLKQEDLEIDGNLFLKQLLTPLNDPKTILNRTKHILEELKQILLATENNRLELEQLLGMFEVMDELSDLIRDNDQIKDLKTLTHLLRQLLPLKKLDFIGEPVKGLQIMGLLETRALDYKNILMLSVNEGILPAGKAYNSYIPHEMKRAFNLPTYTEKDSVYAYHFYRLLHRCDSATFIYNSESDTLGGGEKSRFLLQLERDGLSSHQIKHTSYFHKVHPITNHSIQIIKEPLYFERLKEIATTGFSPSALTSYVRNPIDFFSSKILRISDLEDVEEDIALNTMGSIIHEALDKLYQPFQKVILKLTDYEKLESQIKSELDLAYTNCYQSQSIPVGKNKIIYEVALHYVKKMIAADKKLVQQGNDLIITSVEQDLATTINIENIGTVKLHGKVDRVDQLNGVTRIIDYKTGSVNQRNVSIDTDYSILTTDYERSKAFQVLMYAYLYLQNNPKNEVEAGILSFKNFSAGFISFATKPKTRFESQVINNEVINSFEQQLTLLIKELFNPAIPLLEKEI